MNLSLKKYIILLLILIAGCSADLKTKEIVKTQLRDKDLTVISSCFNITYVENHAVAFGLLGKIDKDIRIPLIFVLVTLEILFLFYMIWYYRDRKLGCLLPFVFILAGAFGNNIDRAVNGFVTDYIHLYYKELYSFYVFNLADILINIGLILLLCQYKNLDLGFIRQEKIKKVNS